MIQANELRIGHLVKDKDGKIIKVTSINQFYIGVDYSTETIEHSFDDIFSIDLELRILTNSGFSPVKNRKLFNLKPKICYQRMYPPKTRNDECFLVIIKDEGEFNHVVPADNAKDCSFIPIKSVHQLQNLFLH